ncbi:MAG: pimeloyl-[acyl-carrier protein] methyl ester esterase [Planctomycetota bacterium]|jgi:pimeloyl-[acyl-carrier protein] methyl ester esterase
MNWLFLKGVARGQIHWHSQLDAFREQLPAARIHCLDLPGVGQAATRRTPISVSRTVEDLRSRWVKMREESAGEWCVMGISLGGMITIEWLHRHPGDFQAGVAIVPSAGNVSPPWRRLVPSALPGYIKSLAARDVEVREQLILTTIVNDIERRQALVKENVATAHQCPLPTSATLRQLLAASLWSAPKELQAPLLFLGSEGDRMVHPSCTRRLAARFGAPVRMNDWAGHEIPMDDPGWVAAETRDWFASLDVPS